LNVRTAAYIAIAAILLVFGYLALFSIGWPFALTGILMLALIGQRHRFDVLAPALAWPWVFTIGYLLVAPIGCTTTASHDRRRERRGRDSMHLFARDVRGSIALPAAVAPRPTDRYRARDGCVPRDPTDASTATG
jgi:hypothetical protein